MQVTDVSRCVKKGGHPGMGTMASVHEARVKVSGELGKVLVVDDERDLADLAEALLRTRGLEVSVAYSAAEALRILEGDPEIAAVFSDVMMPGMNGLELGDAIRALYPWVKIVMTSGYAPLATLADHNRPYLYVPKPYEIETIIKLLRS